MALRVKEIPVTYDTEEECEPIAFIRYTLNSIQWYLIEKDQENLQFQAYGLVSLGDAHYPEYGYINVPEILKSGAQLDVDFEPRSIKDIKGELECGSSLF